MKGTTRQPSETDPHGRDLVDGPHRGQDTDAEPNGYNIWLGAHAVFLAEMLSKLRFLLIFHPIRPEIS
jgi:hypothetical protein